MTYARDIARIATPVGAVVVEGDDHAITRIRIERAGEACRASAVAVRKASEQLEQFFAGERRGFDLPLTPSRSQRGGVLREAIVAIAFGETATYGDVARRIASSPRAIGQACRLNPFPIVVPCHRIVGGSGHYSAGEGLPTKNWLLDHERNVAWVR